MLRGTPRGDSSQDIVLYDPATGESERVVTGIDAPTSLSVRGQHALVWNLDGDAAIIDLSNGAAMTLGRHGGRGDGADRAQVSFAWPYDSPAALVARFRASEVEHGVSHEVVDALIDTASATDIELDPDIEVFLPSIQATSDGSRAAFYDQRGAQTHVFDPSGGGEVAVPGSVLAITDDMVATRVDEELRFFNLDGEPLGSLDTTGVVVDLSLGPAGEFTDDGTVWFADRLGGVFSATVGRNDVVVHATLTTSSPHYLRLITAVKRAVVASDGATVLLSLDGDDVIRLDGTPVVWLSTVASVDSWTCLALSDDITAPGDPESTVELRLVDLGTGEYLNQVTGDFRYGGARASNDGCTIAVDHHDGTTNSAWIVTPDGTRVLQGVVSDLAADGTAVMIHSEDDALLVFDLTDPEADPIQLDADVAAFTRQPA